MRNLTKALLSGALLAAAYVVAPGAQTAQAQGDVIMADCTYAEYINWYGACRGAITNLCKGSSDCPLMPAEPAEEIAT